MAAIATLMACLSVDRPNGELLAVVANLAARFSTSVVGVCARQLSMQPAVLAIGPGEPRGHELDKFRERLAVVEAEFRSAFPIANPLQWRAQMTAGPTSHYFAAQARSADLLVAASGFDDSKGSAPSEIDISDLLMRGGRPILLATPGVTKLELTRTLVCWKDSRESRRAIADALPILKASQAVDVVELVREQEIEAARERLDDVGDWLQRHGVEANCFASPLTGSESAHLAAIANDLGADLIVAGAFGHSRLREWAFGGVTQDLLARADRCTFVSH